MKTLKIICNNEVITVKEEKEITTVIMQTTDYKTKVKELLSHQFDKKDINPTTCIKARTVSITLSLAPQQHLLVMTADPITFQIYGLSNIHKHNATLQTF